MALMNRYQILALILFSTLGIVEGCSRGERKVLFKAKKVLVICDKGKYFVSVKKKGIVGIIISNCNGHENEKFTFQPLAETKCKTGVEFFNTKTGGPLMRTRISSNAFSGKWESLIDWW